LTSGHAAPPDAPLTVPPDGPPSDQPAADGQPPSPAADGRSSDPPAADGQSTGPLAGEALEAARRRSTRLLVASAALGSIAHIAGATVVVIAARELLGDRTLSGLPSTASIVGSAIGASLLSWLMLRRGRRTGLVVGLGMGLLGALVTTWSVLAGSFVLLLAGMLLFGFGNSSNQLSRYVAADMHPAPRRAWAIGLVVWAATVGAVLGPNLAPVAASLAAGSGMPELAGPFLVAGVIMGLAALLLWVFLRPDPYQLADVSSRLTAGAAGGGVPMARILRRPRVAIAVIALVTGQVVMVGIMTMTPLHMSDHGHHLTSVGFVISAHAAGMFALSPVSARIAAWIGDIPTILVGIAVLATSATLAAIAPPDGGLLLLVALFLLGYGWNLGFLAGSSLLVSGVEHQERTRTEGFADTLVLGSSAVASLSSGLVLAAAGFAALGLLSMILLVIAVALVLRLRVRVDVPAGANPSTGAPPRLS
jgi:MFS family permease